MNVEAEIVRRLAHTKQSAVAAAVGMDASVVNRIAAGSMGLKLSHLGQFLDALGLRVVDAEAASVSPEELAALRTLAQRYLDQGRGGDGRRGEVRPRARALRQKAQEGGGKRGRFSFRGGDVWRRATRSERAPL